MRANTNNNNSNKTASKSTTLYSDIELRLISSYFRTGTHCVLISISKE